MSTLRDRVTTVVLVMMENRSFDHMLGHLSLEALVPDAEGLRAPLDQYRNLYAGDAYAPFRMQDRMLDADLPHEWGEVATQLARSPVTGRYTMAGFVEAYAGARKQADPGPFPDPMGFFPSDQVPVTSFLARTFCPCDRWFAPLPTSTQPNRTMAWAGQTPIFDTRARLIGGARTVLDWLEAAKVRWRVYHDGLSFFALYPSAWRWVLDPDRFRDYERYLADMVSEAPADGPQVILVEPSYQDAPHVGPDRPNDNHAPLGVGWGEEFLRRTYEAARADPERWAGTVMVVAYDEHGGFFDHVPPLELPWTTAGDEPHTFTSTGPRVPSVVVSPLVGRGVPSHLPFDHTSVLQLLAELFTPGQPYSPEVDQRRRLGITSLSQALRLDAPPSAAPPPPSRPIPVNTVLGRSLLVAPGAPGDGMRSSFETAAETLLTQEPARTAAKYPELLLWKRAADAARGRTG